MSECGQVEGFMMKPEEKKRKRERLMWSERKGKEQRQPQTKKRAETNRLRHSTKAWQVWVRLTHIHDDGQTQQSCTSPAVTTTAPLSFKLSLDT